VSRLLKRLINRLEKKGIEPSIINGFIRDLANTIIVKPSMNLLQVNKQLHLLGWDSVEFGLSHSGVSYRMFLEPRAQKRQKMNQSAMRSILKNSPDLIRLGGFRRKF